MAARSKCSSSARRRRWRGRRPPYEASPGGPLCGPSSSHAGAKPDGHTGAAATACNDHVGGMIFVSKSTSRHWDVDFDGTTVDLSTDGRIQARGIPCGPGEALGPVRRAIPGRRVASEGYALFCIDFRYNVSIFVTCVSNRDRAPSPTGGERRGNGVTRCRN